jgi:hypothetical protein
MKISKRREVVVIAASIAAAFVLLLLLGISGGFTKGGIVAWAVYYGHSLAGSFSSFLYVAILFACLSAICLVIWSLGGAFLAIAFPRWAKAQANGLPTKTPRDIFMAAFPRMPEMFLILPAVFFLTIVSFAMGEANMFAPAHLHDQLVIGWEHAIFGAYVFAALGAIHYPHWLIEFIIFSFQNMALILIGVGIFLSYVSRERFRELLVAFCIGILAMVPLWLMLPVLSPQDRFINDVYKLPNPPQLALAIADYHPQPEIASFLQSIRKDKTGLPALPTSTIPSAHVFWAAITGYYLFRARRPWRWLGWIVLPFLIASTFGTMLLAQHYFMDVPAGLTIAALSIWLAHDEITSPAFSRETPDGPPGAGGQ